MKLKTALACCWLLCSATQAQTIYRCGADGRTFSQAPCAGGQNVVVKPAPDEARRSEAQAVHEREQAHADALMREREDRDSRPGAGVALIGNSERLREPNRADNTGVQSKPRKARSSKEADFRAVSPAPRKLKA